MPEDEHCEACAQPIKEGQLVFTVTDGGYIHADCAGDDATLFTDKDENPLPEGTRLVPFPFTTGD